jgi:hypothetical protein
MMAIQHITAGRHSGYPWCCTFFFTFVWAPLCTLVRGKPPYRHTRDFPTFWSGRLWLAYYERLRTARIACPICLFRGCHE